MFCEIINTLRCFIPTAKPKTSQSMNSAASRCSRKTGLFVWQHAQAPGARTFCSFRPARAVQAPRLPRCTSVLAGQDRAADADPADEHFHTMTLSNVATTHKCNTQQSTGCLIKYNHTVSKDT